MSASKKTIGYLVQLGGIAAFTLGTIASVHHVAIGAAFIGGAAAFYIGGKIRSLVGRQHRPANGNDRRRPAVRDD